MQQPSVEFEIPSEWVGEKVYIAFNIVIQPQPGAVGFPGVTGKLKELRSGSIVIENFAKGILGDPGDVTIPKSTIQFVTKVSSIERATAIRIA